MKKITKFISVAVLSVFWGMGFFGCREDVTVDNTEQGTELGNEAIIYAPSYIEQDVIVPCQ